MICWIKKLFALSIRASRRESQLFFLNSGPNKHGCNFVKYIINFGSFSTNKELINDNWDAQKKSLIHE